MTITSPSTGSTEPLDERSLATLFTEARTAKTFADHPLGDEELRAIWDLAKWGPSASNLQPLRVLFVRSPEGRARLTPHVSAGNATKISAASATAILAADLDFHRQIPLIAPNAAAKQEKYDADPEGREAEAVFNATLQAGYFVLAVRARGLTAGPMTGIKGPAIDAEFFADRPWRTLLAVNIGHPGPEAWKARQPRVADDQALAWA